jgi:UDP-glucose:(heptosyl)LPS alpha-1,3-glucosyltransferase
MYSGVEDIVGMNIAFCYESVLPARGGCETYIADLARRLLADRHEVHVYASRWDAKSLPEGIQYHAISNIWAPRFLKPWLFGWKCLKAQSQQTHDVTIGFDKTWGQDVLYPQGGLHKASAQHNLLKHANPLVRKLAGFVKWFDLANWSYTLLERRQYLSADPSLIVVNSYMVRDHFMRYYHVPPGHIHVVRSSIDPQRFPEQDRLKCRSLCREQFGIAPNEVVGLFAAMNYHLKGLEPLLHATQRMLTRPEYLGNAPPFRLMVVGHPNADDYKTLAKRLGIQDHVKFVGYCPEMRNAYFAADFLVHPTFYDPCSLVVLEALACGLPVITSRYNGASELMHTTPGQQEGFVVSDPHDHQQLSWCLAQMLDGVRRQSFAQAARRNALQWTFEQHYRQLMNVLQEAAARRQAA